MTASDTIAAIATARGKAALAIVRVSGAQAIEVAARCFQGADLSKVYSHTLHVGLWSAPDGDALDQVVCSVFRAPRSFTGEDMVEVSCHGGDYVVTLVLQSLLAAGARLAAPGEFTQRAFLNGKLDLVQAEAVADLIHASSSRAHRASVDSLRGRYSKTIDELRMALLDVCALAELEIDFSDEDVQFADRRALRSLLHNTQRLLTHALASYALGELVREGVRVVIAGRPNAGKSTLLNALLGEDRAIVSDTPGTTRDTVAADKEIGGLLFRFIDTAGLHDAVDLIEAEGVRRSREAIVKADLVLYVYDLSVGLAESEHTFLASINHANVLVVGNKADLAGGAQGLAISALKALGDASALEALRAAVVAAVVDQDADTVRLVTSQRHHAHLRAASDAVARALAALDQGMPVDLFTMDLRAALNELGCITGAVTNEDVLGAIFSRFCIGK